MSTQITQDASQQIAEARARWATRRAAAEEAVRESMEIERQSALSKFAHVLPAWMMECIDPASATEGDDCHRAWLYLPGCAPVVCSKSKLGSDCRYIVREPKGIEYYQERGWSVSTTNQAIHDFDQAISLAASFGESWHEMQTEADRRNDAGIIPSTPVPLSALAQQALVEARNSYNGASLDPITVQYATAAALLAIAEQFNLLNDTLMKTDY